MPQSLHLWENSNSRKCLSLCVVLCRACVSLSISDWNLCWFCCASEVWETLDAMSHLRQIPCSFNWTGPTPTTVPGLLQVDSFFKEWTKLLIWPLIMFFPSFYKVHFVFQPNDGLMQVHQLEKHRTFYLLDLWWNKTGKGHNWPRNCLSVNCPITLKLGSLY